MCNLDLLSYYCTVVPPYCCTIILLYHCAVVLPYVVPSYRHAHLGYISECLQENCYLVSPEAQGLAEKAPSKIHCGSWVWTALMATSILCGITQAAFTGTSTLPHHEDSNWESWSKSQLVWHGCSLRENPGNKWACFSHNIARP